MRKSKSWNKYFNRKLLYVALLIAAATGSTGNLSYGAVTVPDNIRVALFINMGAGKYQSLTPAVTLQSAGGLNIVWRDPAFSLPADAAPPGQTVRFAMDGYRALLLETADANAANAALKKVQASSNAGNVTMLAKSGQTVYQLSEGNYASAVEASTALSKWTSLGVTAGLASLTPPGVAGPFAAESGPYASKDEAAAAAQALGNAGLDAFVAIHPQNGAMAYTVRIGQVADAGAAAVLQQAAAAAGGISVRVPAPEEPYAVIRNDVTANVPAGKPSPLYAISAKGGVVLRADPAGTGGIQVIERSKRTYRGSMEMSVFTNSLAVVNEVNFEQYLYSVVGSEIYSSWGAESQKAQAVAARSYALALGTSYKIANVVDTVSSQAYNGIGDEDKESIAAVQATTGVVMLDNATGKPITAYFSSNAGGVTADPTEAWGSAIPYVAGSVQSPDDAVQKGKPNWYYVALPSGQTGYIREDLLTDNGEKNGAGLPLMRVTTDGAALRLKPQAPANEEPITRVALGTSVVPLGKRPEYTEYAWVEAPIAPDKLLSALNKSKTLVNGPLQTLEVASRGPSGRVTAISANGQVLNTGSPDSLRGLLSGLRSTLFDIEETGRYTVLDGNGSAREFPQQSASGPLTALGANGATQAIASGSLFIMDASGHVRAATTAPAFVISGKGYGHGLGMSQWGAKALADQGYDYQSILKYYYKNITIGKASA